MAPQWLCPARAETGKRAVAIVFGVNGFLFASWISRLPAVRDLLHLTPGSLGLLLLCISVGSVSTLLGAGVIVHRLGTRRAVLTASIVMSTSLAVAGTTPPIPLLVGALVLVGIGTAVWDVAMNVEGAIVERHVGRPVMPRFHAGFSLGTVAGAGIGSMAAALALPVAWHLPVVAALGLGAVVVAVRRFVDVPPGRTPDGSPLAILDGSPPAIPDGSSPAVPGDSPSRCRSSGFLWAWREPRTLAIGLMVLGMAFAEGSANDWLAVGLVDGYHVDHAVAALGLGAFVTAMTAARMAGPWTLTRYGRVVALRSGALLVAAGVVAVVLGPRLLPVGEGLAIAVAVAGALAWGAGAALGFPVAMSAAADDPRSAAARVSVVSTIGYVAFLAGPPILGLLGDRVGVVRALLAVGGAVLLSLATAGSARPVPPPSSIAESDD